MMMSPEDKRKIARWLREQAEKLRKLSHADRIADQIARLERSADELWPWEKTK